MGWIADLLQEIPSAARYKSELEALAAKEKNNETLIENLQSEVADQRKEIERLKKELEDCRSNKPLPSVDRGGGGSWNKSRQGRS